MDARHGAVATLLSLAAALLCAQSVFSQPICFVEWSISNSYTIASEGSSYVTLNLYASNNGTADLVAPYNLTIFNPAYLDAFSWNFEVTGSADGVIYGETAPDNAFWETLLADSKNVVNMGGNVETMELVTEPLRITIGGYDCQLRERLEGNKYGTPGSGGSSGGTGGSSGGSQGSSGSAGGHSGSSTSGQSGGLYGASGTAGQATGSGATGAAGMAGAAGVAGSMGTNMPEPVGRGTTQGAAGSTGAAAVQPGQTLPAAVTGPPSNPGIAGTAGVPGFGSPEAAPPLGGALSPLLGPLGFSPAESPV